MTKRKTKASPDGWRRVAFAIEGLFTDNDDVMICSVCGGNYERCDCPGPMQDEYEYMIVDGILYARPEKPSKVT